jgi:hypothetical protein
MFLIFHFFLRGLDTALIQGQEVVIPVAVGVRAQVRRAPCGADDTDIGTPAGVGIEHKERVRPGIDAANHILPSPFPSRARITDVRDVLMRALRMRFGDASNLNVCHGLPLPEGNPYLDAQFQYTIIRGFGYF